MTLQKSPEGIKATLSLAWRVGRCAGCIMPLISKRNREGSIRQPFPTKDSFSPTWKAVSEVVVAIATCSLVHGGHIGQAGIHARTSSSAPSWTIPVTDWAICCLSTAFLWPHAKVTQCGSLRDCVLPYSRSQDPFCITYK